VAARILFIVKIRRYYSDILLYNLWSIDQPFVWLPSYKYTKKFGFIECIFGHQIFRGDKSSKNTVINLQDSTTLFEKRI